jgi:hypothetical protein
MYVFVTAHSRASRAISTELGLYATNTTSTMLFQWVCIPGSNDCVRAHGISAFGLDGRLQRYD